MRIKRLIIKKSRKFLIQRLKNDLSMVFHAYNLSIKKFSEIDSVCLKFSKNTDLAKKNEILFLKLDSQIVPKILETGTFDDFLYYFLKKKLKKNALFIDVGANHGLVSKMISKNNYIKKIITYEPVKSIFELSKLNLKKIKNIMINNYGWSKKNGAKLFYENPINSGDFSLIPNKQRQIKYKFKFKDSNSELQKIIKNNNKLAIILKTDCQGYDFEIFNHIKNNLLKKIHIYVLECSNIYNINKKNKFINKLSIFKKIFISCPLIHKDIREIKPNYLNKYFEYKVEFDLILTN